MKIIMCPSVAPHPTRRRERSYSGTSATRKPTLSNRAVRAMPRLLALRQRAASLLKHPPRTTRSMPEGDV
jgi:hypothetical protein